MKANSQPAFIITGTSSGSGKTTVSLGLMAAFIEKGLTVQPFKCGPDFIDPGLHKLITGKISRNLDLWMSGKPFVQRCFKTNRPEDGISIVEGVMGMFDGNQSSSAALAAELGIPTILVLDVRSMAESAAAIVKGFEAIQPDVAPVGVILNRIASPRHLQLVSDAIKQHCQAEILGYLPRTADFSIPSRHLGLLTSDDAPLSDDDIKLLSSTVTEHIDLDRIVALCGASTAEILSDETEDTPDPLCRIGVARDKAFCFYYEDNFDLLRNAGAELIFFSPLTDQKLPSDLDAIYLGGGYPELYAKQLSENRAMLNHVRKWIEDSKPVYAECGGFMYLTDGIHDQDGDFHSMVSAFPVKARMQSKRASLGYREVTTQSTSIFGPAGTVLRGHEFHYSTIDEMASGITRVYQVNNGSTEGYQYKNVLGGYMHLHFGYNPDAVREFINFCRE